MTAAQAAVGRLLVCPTPIGNLEDVTLRVLSALAEAEVIACEHPRHTRVLLDRHGITAPLLSLNDHNERARSADLRARVRAGASVALVSDAGTPLVSDPGFALVRAFLQDGLHVEVLPGPSSLITALVASGLPSDHFAFVGFLPRRRSDLARALRAEPATLVAFESPRRLAATLELLSELDPERPVAVCRELSKLHEEVRRGSARELAEHYRRQPARGEVVIVIAAPADASSPRAREARVAPSEHEALAALRSLVDAGARPRAAAAAVSRLSGIAANQLYRALTSSPSGS